MKHARIFIWVLVVTSVVASGCLEEPEIDERWTKIEFLDVNPGVDQSVSGSQPISINVGGRVTYRDLLTGFLVAEVRYSDVLAPTSVPLNPNLHTLQTAESVDRILANSVTAGRATRGVTGFDHLMQDVGLSFTAQVPAGVLAGTGYLYLVLYMGSGEEIELQDGSDSLVVTPFVSTDREVLHTGFLLNVTP